MPDWTKLGKAVKTGFMSIAETASKNAVSYSPRTITRVSMYAAGGAAVGGTINAIRGNSFVSGAKDGAFRGGAFGALGGFGLLRHGFSSAELAYYGKGNNTVRLASMKKGLNYLAKYENMGISAGVRGYSKAMSKIQGIKLAKETAEEVLEQAKPL